MHVYRWPDGPSLAARPAREDLQRSFRALWSARFSPDGSALLTVGGERARLWDLAVGLAPRTTFSPHGAVSSAHFAPDGRYLATSDLNGDVKIWDLTKPKPAVVLRLDGPHDGRAVHAAVFAPLSAAGQLPLLLTAGDDHLAKLWKLDLAGGQPQLQLTLTGHSDRVQPHLSSGSTG